MFDSIGIPEIVVVVLIGLFIFGPEKVPKMISEGMAMIRQLRRMATNATSDLSRELGTEITVDDLNPKTFVRKHLLSDEDQDAITRPFREAYADVSDTARHFDPTVDEDEDRAPIGPGGGGRADGPRRSRFHDVT